MDISAPLIKCGNQSGAVTNLSSVRNQKAEACSQLYSLPRRELQALCKQHGIPANKTNVAMADALCAFTPIDNGKAKAAAGVNPLGVTRTVAMKAKVEKKVEIPETSLASFILSGVVKPSPAKRTGKASAVESDKEIGFPQLKTTPLRRGVKRSAPQTVPEEKLNLSRETRALFANAVENPSKSQILTPKKRGLEASVVTTRGTRDLPPAFPEIVTPKKAEVQSPSLTILATTGKSTKRSAKSKGRDKKVQIEEATLPESVAVNGIASSEIPALEEFSRRLRFADELTDAKASEKPETEREVELETEIVEINYAEIEFKDGPVNKKLLGVQDSKMTAEKDSSAQEFREEANERNEGAFESFPVTEFEPKNIASHKELLGLQVLEEKTETDCDNIQVMELAQGRQQRECLETAPETENENMVHADADADPLTTLEELPVVHDHCESLKVSAGRRNKVKEDRTLPMVKDVDDWVLQSELPESHEGAEPFSEIAGNEAEENDQRLLVPVLPGSEGKAKVGFETFCNDALETGRTSNETGVAGTLSETGIRPDECEADTVNPLSKIQVNIDSTLAKAEAFLLKVSAWRAEAERKTREGYGDPKEAVIVGATAGGTRESVNAGDEGEMPNSKKVLEEERSMPSAKKARISLSNEQVSLQEKLLSFCEDEIGASKTEIPSNKKVPRSGESMEPSQLSDKENHSDKSLEDTRMKKSNRRGEDRKKARKYEVLKERSQNVRPLKSNDGAFGATKNIDKENFGQTNLQDLSLRKLRAHVKEKDKVDSSKALQPQRGKNMAH